MMIDFVTLFDSLDSVNLYLNVRFAVEVHFLTALESVADGASALF
jgi:hypothetical protein